MVKSMIDALDTLDTLIGQVGAYEFAAHCKLAGISFEDAYWLVFGRYPTR